MWGRLRRYWEKSVEGGGGEVFRAMEMLVNQQGHGEMGEGGGEGRRKWERRFFSLFRTLRKKKKKKGRNASYSFDEVNQGGRKNETWEILLFFCGGKEGDGEPCLILWLGFPEKKKGKQGPRSAPFGHGD